MAQYWINSIDWECEQNLPEETEITDGLQYPFIIEAPENASEKDIIRALYDKKVDEEVEVNAEGFYEFSITGVDYEPVKEKAKAADEELEDEIEDLTTGLMGYLQTDFRDLKDFVQRGGKSQELAVQLIRKHLIPNLKELADLLD